MSYLLAHNWLAALLSAVAGFGLTWLWMVRKVEGQVIRRSTSGTYLPGTGAGLGTGPVAGAATGVAAAGAAAGAATLGRADRAVGDVAGRVEQVAEATTDRFAGVTYPQGRFGVGTVDPLPDGSMPVGYPIKGNADSMLYHTEESPSYRQTKAEVWFATEAAAKAAGFRHWDPARR